MLSLYYISIVEDYIKYNTCGYCYDITMTTHPYLQDSDVSIIPNTSIIFTIKYRGDTVNRFLLNVGSNTSRYNILVKLSLLKNRI